ncbi:hypothetical protein H2198_005539 [Neophaeococcomyces mojaviensis]|uniref:Uncharacterized protein n=1 Tax=Neophaeococcomyces mojaviensis TaxID=3383035 RepID=A0ACC3A5Z0_9EURO|nr:hypothetical protein H2198_005539 [Knufia sp. JES_112]
MGQPPHSPVSQPQRQHHQQDTPGMVLAWQKRNDQKDVHYLPSPGSSPEQPMGRWILHQRQQQAAEAILPYDRRQRSSTNTSTARHFSSRTVSARSDASGSLVAEARTPPLSDRSADGPHANRRTRRRDRAGSPGYANTPSSSSSGRESTSSSASATTSPRRLRAGRGVRARAPSPPDRGRSGYGRAEQDLCLLGVGMQFQSQIFWAEGRAY